MRAREFISETKGLPFPGTYEQEYAPFKQVSSRKITAMTNEALDSAYPYEGNAIGGKYFFTTDSGIEYKVYFSGMDLVEIAFSSSEDSGNTWKSTLTGTGDSLKVMGTVIAIVQEYVEVQQPDALYFTADNDEPSRVKLYKRFAAQIGKVLPGYVDSGPLDLGSGTAFMVRRQDSTTVSESDNNQITLRQLYQGQFPNDDEMIWNYVSDSDFDTPFTVDTINPVKLSLFLTSQYQVEHIDELFDMMDDEQREIIDHYRNSSSLADQVIVMADGRIVDGNHRALAAVLTKTPIKYIDIHEEALNEIAGAHVTGKLNWDPSLKRKCELVGQTEGFDIYYMPVGDEKLFMILGDSGEMRAFMMFGYSRTFPDRMSIRRIENVSGEPGLATTLAAGLRNMGAKFVIDADEPLTLDGLKWAISLIQKKHSAFNVTDQDGNPIDPIALTKEREDAILSKKPGPTSILIEFSDHVRNMLVRNNKQWLKEGIEGMLKPCYLYYGAGYLI